LTIKLAVPQGADPESFDIYYYSENVNHSGWFRGEYVAGWLVPCSRQTVVQGSQVYVQFQVRHSGIVQLRAKERFSMATIKPSMPDLLLLAAALMLLTVLGKKRSSRI